MSDKVKEIQKAAFDQEVIKSDKTVLVAFCAEWSEPCNKISPIIEEIAKENQDPNLKFVKVDVDDAIEVAKNFGIRSIPTLIIFKGGKLIDVTVGAHPKEKFIAFIKANK